MKEALLTNFLVAENENEHDFNQSKEKKKYFLNRPTCSFKMSQRKAVLL